MTDSLCGQLKNAYTKENLEKIASHLIDAYKKQQYTYIQSLCCRLNELAGIENNQTGKVFSRLIMLYHPDRLVFYQNELVLYEKTQKIEILTDLSHILQTLEFINQNPGDPDTSIDVSFESESQFVYDENEFDQIIHNSDEHHYHDIFEHEEMIQEKQFFDFLTALKFKESRESETITQNLNLKNLNGNLDLSGSHINDLSGIELYTNILSIDLSDNAIEDISALRHLQLLEELYLPYNQISRIETLTGLPHLKKVDLSMNPVKDLSPLLKLNQLEFVVLIGIPVTKEEIKRLNKKGIIVIR